MGDVCFTSTFLKRCLATLACIGLSASIARAETTLTFLMAPAEELDSVFMAETQGYFTQEGIKLDYKLYTSGTTALQTFKTGVGELVYTGELPAVAYWAANDEQYRAVMVAARNTRILTAVAQNAIAKPQDLKGKTVATRVGSTGSWFVSEYLRKNGLSESDVTVKNLDGQFMPAAACRGDVDAIFIWYPIGPVTQATCPDKVHLLTTAEGYMRGYSLLGSRPEWLAKPENKAVMEKFMRALLKGEAFARNNPSVVADYLKTKYGFTAEMTKFLSEANERQHGFDDVFYRDFCGLAAWMKSVSLLKDSLDFSKFVYRDALDAVQPGLNTNPPATCSGS